MFPVRWSGCVFSVCVLGCVCCVSLLFVGGVASCGPRGDGRPTLAASTWLHFGFVVGDEFVTLFVGVVFVASVRSLRLDAACVPSRWPLSLLVLVVRLCVGPSSLVCFWL